MNTKVIGLASDHAGFELKQFVKQWLDEHHMPYKDYGTYTTESCDYPDFGHALPEASKTENAIRASPSVAAEKASA